MKLFFPQFLLSLEWPSAAHDPFYPLRFDTCELHLRDLCSRHQRCLAYIAGRSAAPTVTSGQTGNWTRRTRQILRSPPKSRRIRRRLSSQSPTSKFRAHNIFASRKVVCGSAFISSRASSPFCILWAMLLSFQHLTVVEEPCRSKLPQMMPREQILLAKGACRSSLGLCSSPAICK